MPNTTNCLDKVFTSAEICAIIKECGVSGVQEINVYGLHAIFSGKKNSDKDIIHHSPGQVWNTLEDKKNLAQVELDLVDEKLAELQISDPAKFEELMASKEFTN